ncbi:MAG TPA: Calx-beta domain-containing protein, partial [Pyrinomonadaceae bacterium]
MKQLRPRFAALKLSTRLFAICAAFGLVAILPGATLGPASAAAAASTAGVALAAPATVVYVDDDWVGLAAGTDPDGAGGPATSIGQDAFPTVQGGVNGVASGGTVNVAAGTYDEDVNVNKTLSLLGAGAGATHLRGPIGGSATTLFVTASNATVVGFTITRLGNNTTDWNNPGLNSIGVAMQGQSVTGVVIRDNVITGNRNGLDINDSGGHTIRNNVIDFNRTGFIFRNRTDNQTVTENFITNNWTVGILFLDASGGTNAPAQSVAHSTFSNNNISANWYGQIIDRQTGGTLPAPATTNYKNFIGNWYGTTSPVVSTANSAEPGYAAQIPVAYGGTATPPGGQPDIAGPASANFRYRPFLLSGTDTNVETTPGRGTNGFQGVPHMIVVSPPDQSGWFFFDDNPGVGVGTGGFEEGPATPPLGKGSAFLQVDDTARHALGTFGYGGTRFDDLTELQYSSFQTTNTNTVYAPSLQFDIDYDLNDTATAFQGRLVFEPYQSGTVQQNVWQNWDTLAGKWYGTRATVAVGNVNVTNPCQQATPCTRQQVLASFPNSGIRNTATSFLLFKVGGPWPPNFRGNVDALKLGVGGARVTYDFEPTPQLSIDDVTHAEGDGGTTAYTFTVSLSRASNQTVTVDYQTADATATAAGNDYTAVAATGLSFAPGETTKQLTVNVNGETVFEPDETFLVNLSNASASAAILDAQGVGTITNDDGAPTMSINNVTVAEPDAAGTSNAAFTVSLSNASAAPITVDYETADGTAFAPDDYNAVAPATLTFTPGQTSQFVNVAVNADAVAEGAETFSVNLSNLTGAASMADGTGTGTITDPVTAGQVIISEFRFRGPAFDAGGGIDGSRDEYVELYNSTNEPVVVGASDNSGGWALATINGDGTTVIRLVTIPAGTLIPARGHYLVAYSETPVNPATGGYSLGGYAAPDLLYSQASVADDAGVALFRTNEAANFTAANRLDAAGFNAHAGTNADLFREGAGLVSPGANDGQHAFVRKLTSGFPQDTGNNLADFTFVSTDGGLYGGVQSILGAPGPGNTSHPIQRNGIIKASLINPTVASTAPPNRVRSGQVVPGVPNAYGTLSIQRRFKNSTGQAVTHLRFRVVDITTLSSPVASSPQADMRVLTSTGVVTNSQGQEVVTVTGLTLEAPPAQINGGGLNSTLTVALPGGALASGNSIDVQFLLGVQQEGSFRFLINVEALPGLANS